ncbi:hypothetical protein OEW28_05785 [Defluviimonas sp. WL0002]|uniref:Uncharacterized protein n=1 Tax=Albidovulum marisflavi TaxID=2984159 RepID=A0ABT2ZAI5_9RHOB|nr:hypothetical protein [Defluviimonas sp. WL0002]MCV2868134.1 hypothetical protein [Defluviimonas sp. WL0002]
MSRTALACILALAACAPAATPPEVGSVSYAGATYPIHALGSDPTVWRVEAGGQVVTCRAATEEDCYWSLRNYLQSRAALDDIEP